MHAAPSHQSRPRSSARATTVVVLVEHRYLCQLQPAGLVAALAVRGANVSVVDPDELVHDLRDRPGIASRPGQVVVARGRSLALLTALTIAERFGARTINRSAAVAAVRDKAAMAAALVAAGLPTPDTWVGPPCELVRTIDCAAYPLLLKPVFGDNGKGLRLVACPDNLAAEPWPEAVALAQSVVPNDGTDVKVYVAGDRRWAVRAPSPLRVGGTGDGPEPVPLTPALAGLAQRCGDLFGLDLFGVDCLQTADGPVVVEVNDFPNFRGVPDADEALASYVLGVQGRQP